MKKRLSHPRFPRGKMTTQSATPAATPKRRHRRISDKGIALITVLSLLAITTLLVAAFFSLAKVELVSSKTYADGIRSRQLAETAVNIVISQIKKATVPPDGSGSFYSWISQPGGVRKYDATGNFAAGYKLYSDSNMVVDRNDTASGGMSLEESFAMDVPPEDWNARDNVVRYTDLNAPIIRTRGGYRIDDVFFPIIDPRAAADDAQFDPVLGFTYKDVYPTGDSASGVVEPSEAGGGDDGKNSMRVPMPVEWLYVLEDGTMGYLDSGGTFLGASPGGGSISATNENPIVGRVAFWTDDESCKINVNTASEPTFWHVPTVRNELDLNHSAGQPIRGEFQRYPGHPAMTALSPVLFPEIITNENLKDDQEKLAEAKERIYGLVPRINGGGSESGTKNYLLDGSPPPPINPDGDRLYATLDEVIFAPVIKNGERELHDILAPNTGGETEKREAAAEMMERSRFFLTANSRSPETTIFNTPRISMWPLHVKDESKYRTSFDNMISFCNTVNGVNYSFLRENADSPTDDYLRIRENRDLFDYLLGMASEPLPGYGSSFEDKYGTEETHQILTEIFDYIRCTNLYDDLIAKAGGHAGTLAAGPTGPWYTYTDPRSNFVSTEETFEEQVRVFFGHGQVAPIEINNPGAAGTKSRGMGRIHTISEASLHFICNASGDQDSSKPSASAVRTHLRSFANLDGDGQVNPQTVPGDPEYDPEMIETPAQIEVWGGQAVGAADAPDKNFYYSNFPPLASGTTNPREVWNTNRAAWNQLYPAEMPYKTKCPNYPGYNPANWNYALDFDKPLDSKAAGGSKNGKRIEMVFLLELFCPSLGYTFLQPDLHISIEGLDKMKVNGKDLFPTKSGKSTEDYFTKTESTTWGGAAGGTGGVRLLVRGTKSAPKRGNVPADPDQESGKNPHRHYSMFSNFVDLDGDDAPIEFDSTGPVRVEIYLGRNRTQPAPANGAPLLQTFEFDFPKADFEAPDLVTSGTPEVLNALGGINAHETAAPYWWSFHKNGCLGRAGGGEKDLPQTAQYGRLHWVGEGRGNVTAKAANNPYRSGQWFRDEDTIQSVVPWHGDYRHVLAARERLASAKLFVPHLDYGQQKHAHNLADGASTVAVPGYRLGNRSDRMIRGAEFPLSDSPDWPMSRGAGVAARLVGKYQDYDDGLGDFPSGAYINKPDEGNTRVRDEGSGKNSQLPYWVNGRSEEPGESYFSPNRMIPSPGMLGSLPSGIRTRPVGIPATFDVSGTPWRTLLFRPGDSTHDGSPDRPFQGAPGDHILLDFFWMPVVEPYPVSEPLSTAGKINLNYQIIPFTNIERATGIYGVLQSEKVLATALRDSKLLDAGSIDGDFRFMPNDGVTKWWKDIDMDETLKQFRDRFDNGEVFKTASEICNVHIVPEGARVDKRGRYWFLLDGSVDWWKDTHATTGENSKERPYTNTYPRFTTKSNTFNVHVRAQAIQKSKLTDPNKFVQGRDSVVSEYRGSTIVERYIDPNEREIPDYRDFAGKTLEPLDDFYQFRVVSTKRFAP